MQMATAAPVPTIPAQKLNPAQPRLAVTPAQPKVFPNPSLRQKANRPADRELAATLNFNLEKAVEM